MEVVSKISSKDRGGKIEANALASMVLPVPAGPDIITLCPPAAAISNPLLAVSCPLMSENQTKFRLENYRYQFPFSAVFLKRNYFLYQND